MAKNITDITFKCHKHNNILFLLSQLRNLLERLQNVCDELKDENEIAIIEKYGYKAKRYTYAIICKITYVEFYYMLLVIEEVILNDKITNNFILLFLRLKLFSARAIRRICYHFFANLAVFVSNIYTIREQVSTFSGLYCNRVFP